MAEVYPDTDAVIARLPEVRAAVMDAARAIAARAETLLAQHHQTGNARIEVTRGERTDAFVSLVDEAAVSIEYGHVTKSGRVVAGLYIITRAANL
jgi:hypothetical protein